MNMASLTVGSFNVRGLGDNKKRQEVFQWLKDKNVNIVMLQETHCTDNKITDWSAEWGHTCIFNNGSSKSAGVCILCNNNFDFEVKDTFMGENGRVLLVKIVTQSQKLTIGNVYGPNSDDANFFKQVFQLIEPCADSAIIIGGDFNCVINPEIDKKGGTKYTHTESRKIIQEETDNLDLIDIWRVLNPETEAYTWKQRKKHIFCRLDFFLTSLNLCNTTKKAQISHGYRSDHSYISLELAQDKIERGPGFWKLNTSHLIETEYVNLIKDTIKETQNLYESDMSPTQLWEIIKYEIKKRSINYGAIKKKETNKEMYNIEKELNVYDKLADILDSSIVNENIEILKLKLQELQQIRTEGILLRAKARWVADGEKNTKYFFGLEKRNYLNKTINRLVDQNGTEIVDAQDILKTEKQYYETLYTEPPNYNTTDHEQLFFPSESEVKLTENEKNTCEGKISNTECKNVIKTFQNGKSPGTDGLPAEFYKIFWNDIGNLVTNAFNHAYGQGEMTTSQKQSIITLLPKKDKDTSSLSNWRPISLLNTDYKIMTKCIAVRLKTVLPSIIHKDQTGFMKNRYIGENIRLILEAIDHIEDNNLSGMLLSVDFEKAFDTVNWTFLNKTLDHFNFGMEFKRWINLFYTNITSCVINNGWSTGFFNLSRGVRQGCPISPYLFILCAEILAISLRTSNNITGIKVSDYESKLAQYADDMQLLLDGSLKSLTSSIDILTKFGESSGLKININKSEIACLGTLRKNIPFKIPSGLKVTDNSFRILGIHIPINGNKHTLQKLNFEPKLNIIEGILHRWLHRKLTLMGKATIIKTLVIPQLTYLLSVLPTPDYNFLQKVDKLIWSFDGIINQTK
jgi:exonuclease III